MARAWRLGVVPALCAGALAWGCGSNLKMPTELRPPGAGYAEDKSYQLIGTWKGMAGVRDILLTQGTGSQLFLVFNPGPPTPVPRGEVRLYPRFSPNPVQGVVFRGLNSPTAIATGAGRLFVLDEGDTALARDPVTHKVTDFDLYWRVRVYTLVGGDTVTSFTGITDTTMAAVKGIAADDQGNVYVAGTAIILVPNQDNAGFSREFQSRIYRYASGPLPGGRPDARMPGCDWHRDSLYVVTSGTGSESVNDPHGLQWGRPGGVPSLYIADYGNNAAKKLSAGATPIGYLSQDGAQTGVPFNGVEDIAADIAGYFYVCDTGNRRVVRYDDNGVYVQKVNVELDVDRDSLLLPVVVAANDSLAYVFDAHPSQQKVQLYQRRR